MFHHPITKQEIEFKSKDDLIHFLQSCNPLMMRNFKKQYEAKYPDFEIRGFGLEVEIRKISKKDKWFIKL